MGKNHLIILDEVFMMYLIVILMPFKDEALQIVCSIQAPQKVIQKLPESRYFHLILVEKSGLKLMQLRVLEVIMKLPICY
jgi:hypothetical protein